MGQWQDSIRLHTASSELADIEATIELVREAAAADSLTLDAWLRIERVTHFVHTYLDTADPLLVTVSLLDNVAASLAAAKAQLSQFGGNGNAGHLINANVNLDHVLLQLASMPRLASPSEVDPKEMIDATRVQRNAVDRYMQTFQDQGKELVVERESLLTRVKELTAAVTAEKARADGVIATMQQQFATAQEGRGTEHQAGELKRAEEFRSTMELHSKAADEMRFAAQESFQSTLDAASGEQNKSVDGFKDQASAVLNQLAAQKTQAEKVVGIISNTGMVYGYQQTANEERRAGQLWKGVAAGALCIWILAGLVFFALTYDKDLSWPTVVRQLLISTPFVLLAGFAALQVSKHQREERSNRQAELEIASIDPYLASMDDAVRNDVKRSLAERFFGKREAELEETDAKSLRDLIAEGVSTLKQMQTQLKKPGG